MDIFSKIFDNYVGNDNGNLVFGCNFSQSCKNIRLEVGLLKAISKKMEGSEKESQLNIVELLNNN